MLIITNTIGISIIQLHELWIRHGHTVINLIVNKILILAIIISEIKGVLLGK